MGRVIRGFSFVILVVLITIGSWKLVANNDTKLANSPAIAKGSEYGIAKKVVEFCVGKSAGCIEKKLHSLDLNFTDYVSLLDGFLLIFERNESTISCHQLLHEVGREAGVQFEKEGLKGEDLVNINKEVWVECGFGFTHGLVEYLPSNGNSVSDMDKVKEICGSAGLLNSTRDACFHGGGHLLWQHWGKNESLNSCYLLSNYDTNSCLAGVWMKEKDVLYTKLWSGKKVEDEELPWIGDDFCDKLSLGGGGECALAYAPLAVALDRGNWIKWCLAKVDAKDLLRCGDNYSYEAVSLQWGSNNNNVRALIAKGREIMKVCTVGGCEDGLVRAVESFPIDVSTKDEALCEILDNQKCSL